MIAQQLFQPFRLKSLELKNRMVMAPMTRSFSPGGVPASNVADYYARRAEGEVGLIVSEGTVVKPCHTSASVTVVMKRWAGSWAYNQSSNPGLGRGFLVSLTAFVSSTKFTAGLV